MSRWRQRGRALLTSLIVGWVLCAFGAAGAHAEVRGMISRMQGDDIMVSIGLEDGVKPGTKLFVYDALGHAVATVQVTEVDQSGSHVQVVSMEPNASLALGNQVSDSGYNPAPLPIKGRPSASGVAATQGTSASGTVATGAVRPATLPADATKAFAQTLKTHTQVYSFKGGKGGAVKIPVLDILNIATTLGIGPAGSTGVIHNPWLVTSTVYDSYNTYQATAKANQRARSYMQFVYWDASLVDAYADYYLYKENVVDPTKRDEMRRSLIAQKGASTSAVFQVKIRNAGPGPLQLSPFDWHCYMLDPQGNRVKAERYDEALDKALNPGQEVDGYVYFPRRDPVGKTYVADPPTLLIEDVFSERATIKFKQPVE